MINVKLYLILKYSNIKLKCCPNFISMAVIKHPDNSGERGFIWLTFPDYNPSFPGQEFEAAGPIHSQKQRVNTRVCACLLLLGILSRLNSDPLPRELCRSQWTRSSCILMQPSQSPKTCRRPI